jgi:hypothetical protein
VNSREAIINSITRFLRPSRSAARVTITLRSGGGT